jgi:hypothetical protein
VRFKLDEKLSRRAADLIRANGHDAVTVASEGLRGPIITFVNELDREGRDPFDLLDEIEQALALASPRLPGRSAWGATFSAPMTFSPMRCYCSSAVSTTGSPSRSGAAA